MTPDELASHLRVVLGGDRGYRKFVRQLTAPRSDGLVQRWQSVILDILGAKHGLVLPRRAEELCALLPPLPAPRLDAAGVPDWVRIDELGGMTPLQAWGTAGAWRWYFRARHNSWILGAVLGDGGDPVAVDADSANTFYAEDDYGDSPDEPMDLDEARFLIVRELTRLRELRGLGDLP